MYDTATLYLASDHMTAPFITQCSLVKPTVTLLTSSGKQYTPPKSRFSREVPNEVIGSGRFP